MSQLRPAPTTYAYYLLLVLYTTSRANTSERSSGSRVWCLGPLLWFLASPQFVRLLSNAKSAALGRDRLEIHLQHLYIEHVRIAV